MATSAVVTLRLSPVVSRRLARLAKSMDRTRSRLAADAIEKYLDDQSWQVEAIEAGVRAADDGDLHAQSDVEAWVESWGSNKPRARPK